MVSRSFNPRIASVNLSNFFSSAVCKSRNFSIAASWNLVIFSSKAFCSALMTLSNCSPSNLIYRSIWSCMVFNSRKLSFPVKPNSFVNLLISSSIVSKLFNLSSCLWAIFASSINPLPTNFKATWTALKIAVYCREEAKTILASASNCCASCGNRFAASISPTSVVPVSGLNRVVVAAAKAALNSCCAALSRWCGVKGLTLDNRKSMAAWRSVFAVSRMFVIRCASSLSCCCRNWNRRA